MCVNTCCLYQFVYTSIKIQLHIHTCTHIYKRLNLNKPIKKVHSNFFLKGVHVQSIHQICEMQVYSIIFFHLPVYYMYNCAIKELETYKSKLFFADSCIHTLYSQAMYIISIIYIYLIWIKQLISPHSYILTLAIVI